MGISSIQPLSANGQVLSSFPSRIASISAPQDSRAPLRCLREYCREEGERREACSGPLPCYNQGSSTCVSFMFQLYISQFSSVAQLCPSLCDPMNHSTPGLPVHHQLPEFTQTHVHQVSYAIQPYRPLLSLSPPAPNPSQHQGLFQ